MTTFESRRAAIEARRAVAARPTSGSEHEVALQKYLAATSYLAHPTAVIDATNGNQHSGSGVRAPRRDGTRSVAATDRIVVGIEGSACARDAAWWAAAEAERHAASLVLLYTYVLPPVGFSGYNPYPPNVVDDLRAEGCAVLADTESELRRTHPDLQITTRMMYGDPKKVLARASAGATLTVVGAHGRNRVGMALGSVAGHLAHANPAPVAVIRPGTHQASGPVVVGVDGSTSSDAALTFALRTAAVREASLIAVHCWQGPAVEGLPLRYDGTDATTSAAMQLQRTVLEDRLLRACEEYPTVGVELVLIDDRPTPALLRYTENAQLMVVGSRGHNPLSEMMLGSTGQALITRSAAPVVVVPAAS